MWYKLLRNLPQSGVEIRATLLAPDDPLVVERLREFRQYVDADTAEHYGDGAFELYAFTYPSLRRLAELEGRDRFPVKVGFTSAQKCAVWRIKEAMLETAAFPERAHLLVTWRATQGRELERRIHAALKALGRRSQHAPGKEWFETNVGELLEVFEQATQLRSSEVRRERAMVFKIARDGFSRIREGDDDEGPTAPG